MELAPLPPHAVPVPPWADYNTRVSVWRAMKLRHGRMEQELYPPGQHPGYWNPWVTLPCPLQPAPNTAQYGGPWAVAKQRPEAPKEGHAGWVWVQAGCWELGVGRGLRVYSLPVRTSIWAI